MKTRKLKPSTKLRTAALRQVDGHGYTNGERRTIAELIVWLAREAGYLAFQRCELAEVILGGQAVPAELRSRQQRWGRVCSVAMKALARLDAAMVKQGGKRFLVGLGDMPVKVGMDDTGRAAELVNCVAKLLTREMAG